MLALAGMMLGAAPLIAQETTQAPQQQTTTPPQEGGLLNEIGKLLKSPADLLPSLSKPEPAPEPPAAPPPAAAAPPAAEPAPAGASTRMFPGMASGRETCPPSANGAPDCQIATDKLCQSKGYKSGKSLSTDSAFTCSARMARAEGRKPCGTEYFVTSAFCQ